MKDKGFIDLGFAKLDINRQQRRGLPEIIYAPGKTNEQLKLIVQEFKKHVRFVCLSKLEKLQATYLKKYNSGLQYYPDARLAFLGEKVSPGKGLVTVVSAGTSDRMIAQEAACFLEFIGNKVKRFYDLGVAGINRLLAYQDEIKQANVVVVVAGMDAALLSVVAGLVKVPVIGVPTSVGYGSSFKGVSALLAMLNCCSLGVTVVNIDNGLGAGYAAHLINQRI